MSTRPARLFSAFRPLFALAALAPLAGCGAPLDVSGRVVSCADKSPLPDATVWAEYSGTTTNAVSAPTTTKTSPTGAFHLGAENVPAESTVTVKVEKKGYETGRSTLSGKATGEQVVCLNPSK